MSSSTVTCIINAYNRPDFLREAIASVLAQTRPPDEIIVVDDCSPRDLSPAVEPFAPRVRHLRLPENRGLTAARNAGVAAASGELIAFLDDDDQWLPAKLARQVAALTTGYEASLCGWRRMGGDGCNVWHVDEIDEDMLRWGNPFCGGTGLVARRDVLLAEPFDSAIAQGEDWDIFVRLARRRPLAYVAEPLFLYRSDNQESMTRSARREAPAELLARAAVLHKHRRWLGERQYRNQLASFLLNSISWRPRKHRYVMQALRHAGLRATLHYVLLRTLWRDRRGKRRSVTMADLANRPTP